MAVDSGVLFWPGRSKGRPLNSNETWMGEEAKWWRDRRQNVVSLESINRLFPSH